MAKRLEHGVFRIEQDQAFFICAELAALCADPVCRSAGLGAGCRLTDVIHPVMCQRCNFRLRLCNQDRALCIGEVFMAGQALPVLSLAGRSAGRSLFSMMHQLMAGRRDNQVFIGHCGCTLGIRIERAAVLAEPVLSRTGLRAGRRDSVIVYKLVYIGFCFKGFLSDMAARAGIVIHGAGIAGAALVVTQADHLLRIGVMRSDAEIALDLLGVAGRSVVLEDIRQIGNVDLLIFLTQICNLNRDVVQRFRHINARIFIEERKHKAVLILRIADGSDVRLEINRAVDVLDIALRCAECSSDAVKIQRTGALQTDAAGLTVEAVGAAETLIDMKRSGAGQGQIAICIDRGIERAGSAGIQGILTDQLHGEVALGNDGAVGIDRVGVEMIRCRDRAEVAEIQIHEGQGIALRIVMPAVFAQIAEVLRRHRIPADIHAVIALGGAECLRIDPAVNALPVVERIIGVGFKAGDALSALIVDAVYGDVDAGDIVAVFVADISIHTVSAGRALEI